MTKSSLRKQRQKLGYSALVVSAKLYSLINAQKSSQAKDTLGKYAKNTNGIQDLPKRQLILFAVLRKDFGSNVLSALGMSP